MSNYPPGTGPNDSAAPWNLPDLPDFEPIGWGYCDDCELEEPEEEQQLNIDNLCEKCFNKRMEEEDESE